MELIEFLRIMYKRKILLLSPILIGLLLGIIVAKATPTVYKSSLLVYVQRATQAESATYFNYDGYYALQTGTQYTDTVAGLIKSLDVLRRAAEITSYIPKDSDLLSGLSEEIAVVKKAPQLIQVDVTDRNKEKSQEVVMALAQAARERVRLLNQSGDKALSIGLVNEEPLTLTIQAPLFLYGIGGTGLGLIVGLLTALLIDMIRRNKTIK